MLGIVLLVLQILVTCSGQGNIKLLEKEIDEVLKLCTIPDSKDGGSRQVKFIFVHILMPEIPKQVSKRFESLTRLSATYTYMPYKINIQATSNNIPCIFVLNLRVLST